MPSATDRPPTIMLDEAYLATSTEERNKYGVPLSVWATLTSGQKNYYYNKLSRKNCGNATGKKYWANLPQERREIIYARYRQRRLDHPEEVRKKDKEHHTKNAERIRASARRSYYKHHAKQIEKHKRRWDKVRSLKLVTLSPDAVLGMINNAVSRALPRFVRDDVVAAMCLAVLEGKLLVENISKEASKFLRAYNREFDHFKTISLDAPLAGCDGLTLLDRLADPRTTDE